MLFSQAVPPTGWTIDVTEDDRMLRLAGVAPGGTLGGTVSPISFDWLHGHTGGSHALTINELPPISVGIRFDASSQSDNHTNTDRAARGRPDGGTVSTSATEVIGPASAAHNHGTTSLAGGTWTPKYMNIIVGVKD